MGLVESMTSILIDTGPLVALYNPNDPEHQTCSAVAATLPRNVLTTWPVVTEASYLLRRTSGGFHALSADLIAETFQLQPLHLADLAWITRFSQQYADQRPQLADCSLMCIAERLRISTVFTLDRRDFHIFRFRDGTAPHLLPTAS